MNMTKLLIISLAFVLIDGTSAGLAATPNKQTASGIFALLSADTVKHPFKNLAGEACWTNPNVAGVVLRTDWATTEPVAGQYNWSFLDTGLALGQSNHKKIGISVVAGVSSPAWIYALGAKQFILTGYGPMPSPWDAIFQSNWGQFLKQLALRYDSNPQLAFVTMAGPGRTVEYFFALSRADTAQLISTVGIQGWVTAANQNTDAYAKAFLLTPFFCATGLPLRGEGPEAMTSVVQYGLSAYPGRFGVQSNALSARYPTTTGPFPHTSVPLAGLSPIGFQMLQPVASGKLGGTLAQALTNGIALGAHFIEVYDSDCEDPNQQSAISSANQTLVSKYPWLAAAVCDRWKLTPKTPTALTNGFLAEHNSTTVNGHRLFTSKEVGNFAIFSTRFSSVLVVLGGAVSVLVDPYTQAHANQVVVTTDLLLDVVLRHPEALCVGSTTF
jgi:hypothetical protein